MAKKTMIASGMTDGQIETALAKVRDAMRKHRNDFLKSVAQQVLGVENLGMEMFAPFRKHAEMMSKFIVRHVKVNRNRPPRVALQATGRNLYVNDEVVAAMPKGKTVGTDVVFFKPDPEAYKNGVISDDDLEKEYEKRGLVPADPYSLSTVNEADPTFADEHPNGTHWKDAAGKWCFASFNRWSDERYVIVDRDVNGWDDDWWFAGVRKSKLKV